MENNAFKMTATPDQIKDWALFFDNLAALIPCTKPSLSISEHAEQNRVLPAGERYPGPLNLDRSPFVREIMDNMSPMSPIRHTIVMKAAQVAITMIMECIMCYYIGYAPADQLLITATAELYRKWVGRRLEPAISSYGYREKIFAQEKRKSGKESGDKIASKEYAGGQADIVSAQAAASLRSLTKRILIRDEVDGTKEQLDTGEGSFLDVSMARTKAWGDLAKIMDASTPTIQGQSAIQRLYETGDQRLYFVPCPHCGKFQVMKWPGFRGDTEAGILKIVYYQCEACGDAIFEHHKIKFLPGGHWEPTAQASRPLTRSYHIPGWYAPLGFSPWLDIYQTYLDARGNSDKLRSFTNLDMGLPFRDVGARPSRAKVLALQGNYKAGTVPEGVLYLSMAIDVQQGSADDKKNPPRLEAEICGHGAGYRTWSIQYLRFEGAIDNAYAGAWEKLRQYANKTELTFKRKDGFEFPVQIIFIDSGDGTMVHVVYQFTGGWQNTYPISGFSTLKKRKEEKGDELTTSNLKRYRLVNNNNVLLIQISTNYYKTHLYNNLNIRRKEFDPQNPGFCDFPADAPYDGKYFDMLTAEEKRKDGSFYSAGRHNEALDCRVYNQCAGDFYLDNLVAKFREHYKNKYHRDELRTIINHRFALEWLAKKAGVKI